MGSLPSVPVPFLAPARRWPRDLGRWGEREEGAPTPPYRRDVCVQPCVDAWDVSTGVEGGSGLRTRRLHRHQNSGVSMSNLSPADRKSRRPRPTLPLSVRDVRSWVSGKEGLENVCVHLSVHQGVRPTGIWSPGPRHVDRYDPEQRPLLPAVSFTDARGKDRRLEGGNHKHGLCTRGSKQTVKKGNSLRNKENGRVQFWCRDALPKCKSGITTTRTDGSGGSARVVHRSGPLVRPGDESLDDDGSRMVQVGA